MGLCRLTQLTRARSSRRYLLQWHRPCGGDVGILQHLKSAAAFPEKVGIGSNVSNIEERNPTKVGGRSGKEREINK